LPLHKVVVHRWLADIARDEYGDNDVSVAPNSVDTVLFNAPPRGKQAVPTIGMMYSETAFKGCDVALRAVEIARQTRPEIRLVAFGALPPSEKLPLPPGTEFVLSPPQTQIRDIYASCDAWLFSSRTEGFGLPILESMACRTPVIGTPCGAAPDLLDEGRGILVPFEDPEAMAAAILRVADMPEPEWKAMSEAAHAEAMGYTWEHATELFERALMKAAGGNAK
jgi:glycosyltransferase involved in cell wall biosynthesis